ncbi:hypothetical protein [Nonomuraea terrae]|uniref:hypothetical protein n=1 Tax=Nonomuraea terrae TaxID=2530383 RepID=UPI001CB6CCE6|nr:hypothetical protein [Nonomuraea terrae]
MPDSLHQGATDVETDTGTISASIRCVGRRPLLTVEPDVPEPGDETVMRARFPRPWMSAASERLTREVAGAAVGQAPGATLEEISRLAAWNGRIHRTEAVNLNPRRTS